MRYIAKKKGDKYEVTGISNMKTPKGKDVEVIIGTKDYDRDQLIGVIKNLSDEKSLMLEKYDNDMKDLNAILDAIDKGN